MKQRIPITAAEGEVALLPEAIGEEALQNRVIEVGEMIYFIKFQQQVVSMQS